MIVSNIDVIDTAYCCMRQVELCLSSIIYEQELQRMNSHLAIKLALVMLIVTGQRL